MVVLSLFTNQLKINKYGISGQAVAMAFEQTQSLFALATNGGEIHVFGKEQVEFVFNVRSSGRISQLKFVKGIYLVAVDTKDTVFVLSLYSKKLLYSLTTPGRISVVEVDPSLDWMLVGLQSGAVIVYDVDRGMLAPFSIANLQKDILPREKLSPVVSIQWSPRDINTLLIGYSKVTVVYSIATNEVKQQFVYEIPANALGGDCCQSSSVRIPNLIQALYHPNSLHMATLHEDGSIVFWDAITGERILARSLFDVDVDFPQQRTQRQQPPLQNTKFLKASWICEHDPELTALLIAGGDSGINEGIHNLTLFDFGTTPKYSLTSYDKMGRFYSNPKQQRVLPIQNDSEIVDYVPLAQSSPFFGGNHNPNYIMILLRSGEIEIMDYPSGRPNHKSSLFPQSIAWIHPKTSCSIAFATPRKQWLGMISRRQASVLKGGFPSKQSLSPKEVRCALATGHINGAVTLFDASHEKIGGTTSLDVDVSAVLNTYDNVAIDKISFAGETAELAAATLGGEVALFKFDINKRYNSKLDLESSFKRMSIKNEKHLLVDLSSRTPNIPEGFLPVVGIHARKGRATALKNSSIGFVAIAYERGDLIIMDRRGPAIIYFENIKQFSTIGSGAITSLEYSIMAYGDDSYSSILLFAGTDKGELFTFKILPESSGRFTAKLIDLLPCNESEIHSLQCVNMESGAPSLATFDQFNKLSSGVIFKSYLIVSSVQDMKVLVPGKSKVSGRAFSSNILTSGVTVVPTNSASKPFGTVLTTLNDKGVIKVYTLPQLKEITAMTLPMPIDLQYAKFSSIVPSGDIIVRINDREAVLCSVIGTGKDLQQEYPDVIYNENLRIPYRPELGTIQWAKSSLVVSYEELDEIIGGPQRPVSKNPESAIAHKNVTLLGQIAEKANAMSPRLNSGSSASGEFAYEKPVRKRAQGGYDPTRYIYRQFQNGIDTAEETFNEYANTMSQNMNDTIGQAKKDLVTSVIQSKFGI